MTFEALSTAEPAPHKVAQAIDTLEHRRLELIQIATEKPWHQTERPLQSTDLGELAALLQVREVLAKKENAK